MATRAQLPELSDQPCCRVGRLPRSSRCFCGFGNDGGRKIKRISTLVGSKEPFTFETARNNCIKELLFLLLADEPDQQTNKVVSHLEFQTQHVDHSRTIPFHR